MEVTEPKQPWAGSPGVGTHHWKWRNAAAVVASALAWHESAVLPEESACPSTALEAAAHVLSAPFLIPPSRCTATYYVVAKNGDPETWVLLWVTGSAGSFIIINDEILRLGC